MTGRLAGVPSVDLLFMTAALMLLALTVVAPWIPSEPLEARLAAGTTQPPDSLLETDALRAGSLPVSMGDDPPRHWAQSIDLDELNAELEAAATKLDIETEPFLPPVAAGVSTERVDGRDEREALSPRPPALP